MQALSLNGITSRAIQWTRPGRWSWLALLLFIGSLMVAVQFRGSIVEQMQYREHFGDAASLATLNNIILGFSTAIVVAAAVISWRVWWTFSLIGTTALGMPDLGAIGVSSLRASAVRLGPVLAFAGKYLWLGIKAVFLALWRVLVFPAKFLWLAISNPFIYLGKGIALAGKYLALGIKAAFLALWRVLAFAGKYLWLGISVPFIYLGKGIAWAGKYLALGIKGVSLTIWRVLAFVGKYLGLGIKGVSLTIWRVLAFAGKYLWLGISVPFIYLGKGIAWTVNCLWLGIKAVSLALSQVLAFVGKRLGLGIKAVSLALWRVLAFAGKCLWLAISTPPIYLGKGIAWTVKCLGLGTKAVSLALWRVLAFTVKYLWLAISTPFIYLGKVLAFIGKYLGLGIKAVALALSRVLAFTVKYLWLAVSIPFIYMGKVMAWAGKYLALGIKAVFLALGRVLAFAAKFLWLAISIPFNYLGRGMAWAAKRLGLGIKAVSLALWQVLAFVGKCLWLAISIPFIYLCKGIAWAGKHLGLGIKAVSLALARVLAFTVKYLWLAISIPFNYLGKGPAMVGGHLRSPVATFFGYLRPALLFLLVSPYILASFLAYFLIKALASQAVALGARQLWRAISVPSILLVKVTAAAWRSTYPAIAIFFRLAGMALAFTVECLLLIVSAPFIYLGKGIAWTVNSLGRGASLLLLGLIRGMGFASRPVGRAVSSYFQKQATSLQSMGRYLWAAAYTMGRDLQAGLSLLGRFAAGVLAASPRYARAGLIFVLSNLAVAAGILVFSPLILLRLGVDKAYRQKMAARFGRLWTFLKVRPALVLPCLAFTAIIGLTPWYVPRLLPSETPLKVLIWTSEEKQLVLQSALDRFNEDSPTMMVDGRRYQVQARVVPMPSAEMYDHLVAKFDRGTAFPLEIGLPIVVSPSNSDWLGQINLNTGREIFQLDHLRPIVRTPVVIATHRGTAECLGWPERPVGWADLIALTDNPEVWAACPAAGSDWGKQPPLDFGDPATSSTARSALQALLLVGAGKLAEEFSPEDLEGPSVEELLTRIRAASEPSALGSGGFPRDMNLSMAPGHFQPVEEYRVAQYYLRLSEAADGPDSEPDSEIVAVYPKEGTMWHDNPYGIVNASWVSPEQREAALLVQQHLRSREEQDRFMEDGFRPGIYLEPREVLTPTRGLNLKQPQTFLGRLSPEMAHAIRTSWGAEISR